MQHAIQGRMACMLLLSLVLPGMLLGATPASGTLSAPAGSGSSSVAWTGGPFIGAVPDLATCTPLTCDHYTLTVNVPATFYATHPNYGVRVHVTWTSSTNDFDVYVYDATGALVNSSTQGNTEFEEVALGQLPVGIYDVQVAAFTALNVSYNGSATCAPEPVMTLRPAKYKPGNFTFTQPKLLLGPDGVVFGTQDLEPRAAVDALGNIYVAGINGTPGGTDVWRSGDGGANWTYLGQPDGAQAASAMAGRLPGLGGGDEDIAVDDAGRVYMAALWGVEQPMSITMCTSSNNGAVWTNSPVAQYTPLVDRQWIATYQSNIVYLTYQQEGALLVGTTSLFCLKSTDGGLSFTQVTQITTPELGIQPNFQGNIAVDKNNGNVFTVFIGHVTNEVYIARSTDGGKTFVIKLVYAAPFGASLANVFPIVALDAGGNPHVVFSDAQNIYLASSPDKGATFLKPVRVNNSVEAKSNLSPWVEAGDNGKVNIIWWATSSPNPIAADATWKVYFAQCLNTFSNNPTICQNAASPVFHTGPICVNGTGCEDGTRDMAEYASTTAYIDGNALVVYPDNQSTTNPYTYFVKQTGGTRIKGSSKSATIAHQPVEGTVRPVPDRFALDQNYPNPFNPTTRITFAIAEAAPTTLRIYDVLGKEVATIVNGTLQPGYYGVTWNAGDEPSGLYFYELRSGGLIETKKFMLTK